MKQLENALKQLEIEYSQETIHRFSRYMDLILSWNEKVNLTAITDRQEFVEKHFIDSILCAREPEFLSANTVIDVGTGAGFPGMPLAILFPEKQFLLMDSLNKRIRILEEIYKDIGLANVSFLHARAEEAGCNENLRERYNLCVSRAVANLATLSEYCLPFINKGGYFLAYKGPDYEKELAESRKAISVLGGQVVDVRKAGIPEFSLEHTIIYIKKTGRTPSKYPRKAGIPSKEPLK